MTTGSKARSGGPSSAGAPAAVSRSRGRLLLGGGLWLVTRFTPLLVPVVQATDVPEGIKLALSGLLFFGIPELFLLVAIAIMGRDGYRFVTRLVRGVLRRGAPPGQVSLLRYRVGLVLFSIPVLFAILSPYVGHLIPHIEVEARTVAMAGDALLLISLFVLGGRVLGQVEGVVHAPREGSVPRASHGLNRNILICIGSTWEWPVCLKWGSPFV